MPRVVPSQVRAFIADASGSKRNAGVDFGFVSNPRTIGFRFEYIGQGSGIANGASAPGDVTWF